MRAAFTIIQAPRGQGRPRFSMHGTYKATSDRVWEGTILNAFVAVAERCGWTKPSEMPIWMKIKAVYPLKKSMLKAEKQAVMDGKAVYLSKPDIDNIEKSILDALNGHAWNDDKQVCCIVAEKVCGAIPRLEVEIEEMRGMKYDDEKVEGLQ